MKKIPRQPKPGSTPVGGSYGNCRKRARISRPSFEIRQTNTDFEVVGGQGAVFTNNYSAGVSDTQTLRQRLPYSQSAYASVASLSLPSRLPCDGFVTMS